MKGQIIQDVTGQPIGKEFADSVEQGVQDLATGAVNWYQQASQDQEGYLDDALRLTAGGIKNIGNWWAESTRDQEGIGDDILRGVGSVVGTGLRVLDAGSYYGGKLGGGFATLLGVDARIGGAIGNVAGDLFTGGLAAKALKTAKYTKALRALDPIERGAYATAAYGGGHVGAARLAKKGESFRIAATQVGKETVQDARNVASKIKALAPGGGKYLDPVPQLLDSSLARKGNLEMLNKRLTKEESRVFNKLREFQSSGPFAHHHMLDVEFSGAALNRVDADKIIKELNKYGIQPGDHELNIIGLFHDKPAARIAEMREQITRMQPKIAGKRGTPNWYIQDDYLRSWKTRQMSIQGVRVPGELAPLQPPKPKHLGVYGYGPELPGETAYQRRWKTLLDGTGYTRKDIKVSPGSHILGRDHIDIVHELQNTLPDRLDILADIETGEWFKLPPKTAAKRIAIVYEQQRRIAINTAKWRLNLIKQHLGYGKIVEGKFIPAAFKKAGASNPEIILDWILKNPAEAASLGWGTTPADKVLLGPTGAISQELKTIFGLAVDKTTPKQLEKLQKLYPAYR